MFWKHLENYRRRADKRRSPCWGPLLMCEVTSAGLHGRLMAYNRIHEFEISSGAVSGTCGSHVSWTQQPVASPEHGRRKMFAWLHALCLTPWPGILIKLKDSRNRSLRASSWPRLRAVYFNFSVLLCWQNWLTNSIYPIDIVHLTVRWKFESFVRTNRLILSVVVLQFSSFSSFRHTFIFFDHFTAVLLHSDVASFDSSTTMYSDHSKNLWNAQGTFILSLKV